MKRFAIAIVGMVVLATPPCVATVNVVVSTYDGIVVAADSRTTDQSDGRTRVASDYTSKVKRVGSHVAVSFTGAAYLYDTEADLRSIGSLVDQYKSQAGIADSTRSDPLTVVLGLDSALTVLYDRYQKINYDQGELVLIVSGYDSLGDRRIYELKFPKLKETEDSDRKYDVYGTLDSSFASGVTGALVRGQTDVWTRLVKGYDPQLLAHKWYRNVDSTIVDSTDSTKVDTVQTTLQLDLGDLRYQIRYDLMNLQDAIDFAVFIVRATIEAQRFNQASIQGVGGAIDIAVITADGFRWIQRKRLHGEGSPELIEH
jgi:20S proteasome alpha/beta subunit